MKKLSLLLSLALVLSLLAGCAGTTVVYYSDCTCPTADSQTPAAPTVPAVPETTASAVPETTVSQAEAPAAGALKTGLAIVTSAKDSKNAEGEKNGEAKYDVTIVAVLVDENGTIRECIIDGIAASVAFDASGAIVTDLTAAVQTKNELGEKYGMVAYGGAVAEWDRQAAALAEFAVGKTTAGLREGAVNESGYAADADLATSATIYLGGYVEAIEQAVATSQYLGAVEGDTLKLGITAGVGSSSAAAAEAAGNAQLDVDATAITMKDQAITSCVIDSVQAKVGFDAAGAITSGNDGLLATKNQLGEQYGMVAWGGAIAEWNQQAASFAAYITGMNLEQVNGIAVNEKTAPADADLAASVTIAIGGFQALIAKAAQ